MLHHNQTIPALVLSRHLALSLGWDWSGAAGHLTGLNSTSCQDPVAVLATLVDTTRPGEGGVLSSRQAAATLSAGLSSERFSADLPACLPNVWLQRLTLHAGRRSGAAAMTRCRPPGARCWIGFLRARLSTRAPGTCTATCNWQQAAACWAQQWRCGAVANGIGPPRERWLHAWPLNLPHPLCPSVPQLQWVFPVNVFRLLQQSPPPASDSSLLVYGPCFVAAGFAW